MHEENDDQEGGDSAATPVEEIHEPSPTSREEPAQPIGPILNKEKIVLESLDIITTNLRNINHQKHYLASMGYLMHSMQRLLDSIREHEERLNTFLVNDDKLQTHWFLTYHKILPPYGDYSLVLKDAPGVVSVDGIASPIKESVLKGIVDDAVHNLFAGGLQVRMQRQLDVKLNSKMEHLREMSGEDAFPFYTWMNLLAKEIGHEEKLEDKFFEVSTFLDFLNYSSSVSEAGSFVG